MYRIQTHKVKPLLSVLLKQEIRLASWITGFSTTVKANILSTAFWFSSYCTECLVHKCSSQHDTTQIKEICRKSFNLQMLGIVPLNF